MFKFFIFSKILYLIFILISTAFFTLYERKNMGISHYRLGPNKIMIKGLLQPFSDVVKLMSKNEDFLKISSMKIFFFTPGAMVAISMLLWVLMFSWSGHLSQNFVLLIIMLLSSVGVFFLMSMGWVSGSFYSMLGSYRATAQMISYEGIFFIMCSLMFWIVSGFSIKKIFLFNSFSPMAPLMLFFVIMWLISVLAETNRTPFDFSEGESELVSGFNTEYSSGLFSLIFLSEYMSLMVFSYLASYFLWGQSNLGVLYLMVFLFTVVLIRCCYPRFRYDFLMLWSWKSLMIMSMPLILMFYPFNNL